MHATLPLLQASDFPALVRDQLETLQVNLGYRCNQQCLHCHVNAGPRRKEIMSRETIDEVVSFLQTNPVGKLDLTGGAPELHPQFRYLVTQAVAAGVQVLDRCNLTILLEPGQEDLADFLARHQVEIYASLPCYQQENVDGQRGKGVYAKSIRALRLLNRLGYGRSDSGLRLNLVYNPTGPWLPPAQHDLEADYKRELEKNFSISFNRLFTITNMPIMRFGSQLISKGQFNDYMALLKSAYQASNLATVMCRSLLSVNWQGYVYDCDFNQLLDLPSELGARPRTHIKHITASRLPGRPIVTADHCYGCTAGQGSSCGGALS